MTSSALGAVIVAWQTLRAHKLRTLLTCLSLAIAVLALVLVDAASQVAADAVAAQARLTQGVSETWQLPLSEGAIAQDRSLKALDLTSSILQPLGGSAALIAQSSGQLDGVPVAIMAVRGDLHSIRPFPMISGRWLRPSQTPNSSPEVVLGRQATSLVGAGAAYLAIPAFQGRIAARVVGVVDDWASMPTIYVSMNDISLWADMTSSVWTKDLLAHQGDARSGEAGRVLTYVALVTQLGGAPNRIDQIGASADTLATTRTIFLLIAAVALIVGVLGILNIGLVSLRERVEEIALRRATGATRAQISASVLAESVLAAVVSASVAVAIAWFLVPLVTASLFPNLPLVDAVGFPYQTAAVGIVVAALAGLAGGIIPAGRAAYIDIATIMRG